MRNPARKALYCLLALLVAASLIRFGILRHERFGEGWGSTGAIALGLAIVPFPLVILVQALFAIRGRAMLLAGRKVIAPWHVPPADWDRFRGVDARRSAQDFALGNDLRVRRSTPSEGVEVIVGEKGLLVDGSYHGLSPRGLPELREARWLGGSPDCLEFALLYPRGRYGGTVPMTLRVPVPAGARGAAQKVLDHFEPRLRREPGLALRDPNRTYGLCTILLAVSVILAMAAYGFAQARPDGGDPAAAVVLLVGAAGLGAFAIALALATFLLARSSRR